MRNQWNKDKPPKLPGKKVFDQLVKTTARRRTSSSRRTSISQPALRRAGSATRSRSSSRIRGPSSYDPPRLISWVQSTKLAVDAYVDADDLIAFATDLDDRQAGERRRARDPAVRASRRRPTTRAWRRSRSPTGGAKGAHFLIATRGDDIAFVTDDDGWWNESGTLGQAEPRRPASPGT